MKETPEMNSAFQVFMPESGFCESCKKIRNHYYLLKYTEKDQKYYRCSWCGARLKNKEKNRREHGQKCRRQINMKEVCHCKQICVACLDGVIHTRHYDKCGCNYCSYCDPGYGLYPAYMAGFCGQCSGLGFKHYVRDCVIYYKNKKEHS